MGKQKSEKRTGRLFFTGLSMGVADLIPGVSSGTIAFLFGIYEELLYTIKLLTGAFPKLLLRGKFGEAFRLIPFHFLLPVGIGMVLAIFGAVQLISYLVNEQSVFTWSAFFGLVLASAFVIGRRVTHWNITRVALAITGFVAVFLIVGLPGLAANESPLATLGTGVVASMAMIAPGISGTLVMVLLGQYERIITAISDFDLLTIGIFAIGVIIGVATFARVVSYLLTRHHGAVIAVLVGAILGSLRAVWPWKDETTDVNILPSIDGALALSIVLAVVGLLAVVLLERIGIARQHNDDIESKDYAREVSEQKD